MARTSYRTAPPNLWVKLKSQARAMRREPTPAEHILWQALRRAAMGVNFRRQHAIDRFVVDFCCLKARLVVEVDGPIHDENPGLDRARDQRLGELGYTVLRLSNDAVLLDLNQALQQIRAALQCPL